MIKSVLSWPLDDYMPHLLERRPIKELRKEYSRMRSVARKRLQRLIKSGLGETHLYEDRLENLKKVSELTEKQLRFALSDLAKFLENPLSTVTQLRKHINSTIKTIKDRYDLEWLNSENYTKFTQFMEYQYDEAKMGKISSPVKIEYLQQLQSEPETVEQIVRGFRKWARGEAISANKK